MNPETIEEVHTIVKDILDVCLKILEIFVSDVKPVIVDQYNDDMFKYLKSIKSDNFPRDMSRLQDFALEYIKSAREIGKETRDFLSCFPKGGVFDENKLLEAKGCKTLKQAWFGDLYGDTTEGTNEVAALSKLYDELSSKLELLGDYTIFDIYTLKSTIKS